MSALLAWVGPLVARLTAPESPISNPVDGDAPVHADAVEERAGGLHVTYRPAPTGARSFVVSHDESGFTVKGKAVRRLVSRFDLDNEEAIHYLAERLDRLGVYAALRSRGAQPGDEVDIEGYTFEYQ